MSVNSTMTALADQVRRVSGKTGTMTLDEMTAALSDVTLDGNVLPSGYARLECIQSTGVGYIDTGFAPKNDTRVVCKAKMSVRSTANWLFGARTSTYSNTYNFASTANGNYTSAYNTGIISFDSYYNTDDIIEIDKNGATITLTTPKGSVTETGTAGTFTSPVNMTIFAGNSNGTISTGAATVYSFKIYDGDTLIRDYIPCMDLNDNTKGLYDVVNGAFYVLDEGSQTDENNKSVYTGTIATADSTTLETSLTIDTGVTLSDDDIFLLVPNSENHSAKLYTYAAVLVARYAPTTLHSICAEITSGYLLHKKYDSTKRVEYSGTTVTVSGVRPFLCSEYMWILIK